MSWTDRKDGAITTLSNKGDEPDERRPRLEARRLSPVFGGHVGCERR